MCGEKLSWFRNVVYRLSYSAGKADSSMEWKEICDSIHKKPPTGAAPAFSLS